jgi:DNA-binding LacI/PurR family transcriptional regulator
VPSVIVDQPIGEPGVDFVGLDDRGAAQELGRYLGALGHRRIGVVANRLGTDRNDGPADADRRLRCPYAVVRARLDGLAEGLAEYGVDPASLPVEERFDNTQEAGAAAVVALLDRQPDLTAVAALTDVFALAALTVARQLGLWVPDELTVTGFDDVPDAEEAGLTTIRQPMLEKGRVAGQLLLDEGERPAARHVVLPTELVIRNSSGPPRR